MREALPAMLAFKGLFSGMYPLVFLSKKRS